MIFHNWKRFYTAVLACVTGSAVFLCACGAGSGGQGEAGAAAPSAAEEEVETGAEEVKDPDAYAHFEEEKAQTASGNTFAASGLTAQYGHLSSYDVPREEKDGKIRSYLTGKWVDKAIGERRPIAVMLNNIKEAQPMSGTSMADVLYECVVEGSLTRMMGLFENYDDLQKIGSVRSCRNYFVYYALEFDAIYCHYGQSAYAMPLLNLDYVNNLSGLSSEGDTVYYRTTDRVAPHNAYASAKGIKKGIEDLKYRNTYSPSYHGKFTFADDGETVVPEEAVSVKAEHVEPGYLINKPWFDYDESDGRYYRFEYGEPQVDGENSEQLYADNIILQYSSWEVVDDKGYLGFDCHSGGPCYVITRGRARLGTWMRFDGDEGAVRYFDTDGKEFVLNQGKTWVLIIQDSMGDKVVIR